MTYLASAVTTTRFKASPAASMIPLTNSQMVLLRWP